MDREKIYNNLTDNIGLESFKIKNEKETRIKKIIRNSSMLILACISITGMVFAKEISTVIYDNFFETGNGIGKAIEQGYIEKTEMENKVSESVVKNEETGKVVKNVNASLKIDEFIMDDFTLSLSIDVKFADEINNVIKKEDIKSISFPDIVVYDENNTILFVENKFSFDRFAKKHNLEYTFDTIPEDKIIGSGCNSYIAENTNNSIKYVFNLYTGGSTIYPKSKKIYIDVNKIRISSNVECMYGDEDIVLEGDWNFSVDVPEKMYNRSNIVYVQKNTTNKDFNVTSAIVYDTGMDISLDFKAKKISHELNKIIEMEYYDTLPEDSELRTVEILNYITRKFYNTEEFKEYQKERMKIWEFDKYLLNGKGEKFELTQGPRENGSGIIDENNIYHFNGMFDLTKYDMTDEIKLVIDYQGTNCEITLEKKEAK